MRKVALVCLLVGAATVASATTTYEYVANGTTNTGNTVKAEADFSFSSNLLTLTLTNLLVNPSDVAQDITGFSFTLGSLGGDVVSLNPYNATTPTTIAPERVTIAGPGYTLDTNSGKGFDPGFAFAYSTGNFVLNLLANGPSGSIVGAPGSGGYTNANASLTNGAHTPEIYETATWVFQITNLNGAPVPTNIVFSFGTTAGTDYFTCDASCAEAPEPGSLLLLGSGLAGLAAFLALKNARSKRTA